MEPGCTQQFCIIKQAMSQSTRLKLISSHPGCSRKGLRFLEFQQSRCIYIPDMIYVCYLKAKQVVSSGKHDWNATPKLIRFNMPNLQVQCQTARLPQCFWIWNLSTKRTNTSMIQHYSEGSLRWLNQHWPWWTLDGLLNFEIHQLIWVFPKIGGTPTSSILIGFSIVNHPFWGITIFGNTHMQMIKYLWIILNLSKFIAPNRWYIW